MKRATRLAVLALATGGAVLTGGLPAHADAATTKVALRVADPMAPVVVITNAGPDTCQVATTALGTVALSRVEQAGAAIAPIVSYPNFEERLDVTVNAGLRILAPGASLNLRIPVLAGGPTGHLLETVTWSAAAGPVALLYPVRAGQPLRVDVGYAWTANVTGEPLCAPASAVAGAGAGPAKPALTAAAKSDRSWGGWFGVAAIAMLVGVGLAILLPFFLLLRRQRGGTYVVVLFVLLAAFAGTARAPRAQAADFQVDPAVQGAFDGCLNLYRQDGNDPAGILPVLEDPNFRVQLQAVHQDSHEGAIPGGAFVFWDPDDRSRLTGPGGNGTGPAREPCATLYHELYHAKEDAAGGRGNFECVTDAGRSGIGTGEVNATRAENQLRERLGQPVRTVYGGVALPNGDCHPRQDSDRYCTEGASGVSCTCRTTACAGSTGDPHLVTFDGRRYDFQGAGEFVAARDAGPRDPAGGFQLQVRQEPWPGRTDVAVTTAVAMDVAGDRVEVDAAPGGLALLVNGAGAQAGGLPKGGSIATDQSGRVGVTWPDGSTATLSPIGGFGVDLAASAAGARGGKLEGLLGDADGDPANDVRPRGGAPIANADFAALYPRFADSWRVSDKTSLFTYAVGRGAADYVDEAFPERAPVVENRAAAEAICRDLGVTDPGALAGCVLDVGLTGRPDFAVAAATGQQATARPAPGAQLGLPATADIFQCGTARLTDLTGGVGTDPLRIPVPAGTAGVSFPSVTGMIGAASAATSGPDGDPGWGGTDIPPTNGLSGIHHGTQALFLIGVFVPVPPTPPATPDVSGAEQTASFSPQPGELFAIGDGHAATGETQTFAVPAGATALCLGFADANTFKGAPGYFNDNAGSLTIQYSLN